ncbi:MAG: 2-amino-4-hydroxy-6-hydroxymethyldihydropteridine diphosphokinase [Planctomycetota bacterium]|jgi:2-amino-4-hydroxy-6-hydroxymethyldihydropteridine diphosphokinase
MTAKTVYIGLGGNLGDRKANIDGALKMLADAEQITLTRVSDVIETAPLGKSSQPDYLNAVAELRTELNPEGLFKKLRDIETLLGRVRQGKWSPRTIDLDLLLFGDDVVNDPDLTVPHPQMHLRSFVLKGLRQLNGALVHPVMKESVDELAGRLNGLDFTLNSELPQLVSIAGNIGVGKTTLATRLAKRFGCKVLLEPYDTNPFLPEVYAGKKELALDSQLYFLTSRIEQLGPGVLAEGQIYVSDYVFNKELVYARRLLDEQQFTLYEDIYRPLAAKVSAPILVIYMCDSPQDCLERIHSRNRPYEQQIRLQFLETLSSDYERLFGGWKACPVIRVPKAEEVDVEHLVGQIKCYTSGHFIVASGVRQSKI